jgi:hypothetical protein
MRLLKALLEWNPINVAQMQAILGYEIVSKLLKKKEWILDEEMLSILFEFCGVRRSPKYQVTTTK